MVFVDSLEIFSVSTLSRRCREAYVPMEDMWKLEYYWNVFHISVNLNIAVKNILIELHTPRHIVGRSASGR